MEICQCTQRTTHRVPCSSCSQHQQLHVMTTSLPSQETLDILLVCRLSSAAESLFPAQHSGLHNISTSQHNIRHFIQPAHLHKRLHHYTLHALYSWLINFSSTCHNFPPSLVKDCLVIWLLQSGMDYLSTSGFYPLLTPSNATWKLTCSNSPSTPLPCCQNSEILCNLSQKYHTNDFT